MIIVTPAYGREYKTKDEVVQAWKADQDFFMQYEMYSYINKRDWTNFCDGEAVIFQWPCGKIQVLEGDE